MLFLQWYLCMHVPKQDSVEGMHSIVLKFVMDITGCCRTIPIDSGECETYNFFVGVQGRILIHLDQWS